MLILRKTIRLLASFKIAIIALLSVMILVVLGTLFQKQWGLFDVQKKIFRSFLIFFEGTSFKIPVFPGGYLLGGILILNLICSILVNLHRLCSKLGIYLIHAGLVLLLVGEALSSIFSMETLLPLNIGEKKNYSIDIANNQDESRYFPFWIELIDFKHEKHPGTDVPKSFSSTLKIYSNEGELVRAGLITMNNPLKYQGFTFYQSGFGNDDQQSILMVVKNPASLSPYLFSFLVIIGFVYQFIYGFSAHRNLAKLQSVQIYQT